MASGKRDDFWEVYNKQGVRVDEQRGNTLLRERCERWIDFALGACFDNDQFVPQRTRRSLSLIDVGLGNWVARVYQETDHCHLRNKLVEQFDLLCREFTK